MSASDVAILAALITSIIASSAFIGVVNYSYQYGVMPDLSGNSVPGQITLHPGGIGTTTGQDYTSTDPSAWSPNFSILSGNWVPSPPAGMILQSGGLSTILLNGVASQNNVYTVEYNVANNTCTPTSCYQWSTKVRYSSGGLKTSDLTLTLTQTGLELYQGVSCTQNDVLGCLLQGMPGSGVQRIAQVNAPQIASAQQIVTVLDQNENTLSVYNYDQRLMYTKVPGVASNILGNVNYAGITAQQTGFTLRSINANIVAPSSPAGSTATDTGIIGMIFGGISWVTNMLSLFLIMAGFVSSPLIPGWAFMIVITPQVIAILYIAARLARGGG